MELKIIVFAVFLLMSSTVSAEEHEQEGSPGRTFTLASVSGNYGFSLQGEVNGMPIAASGRITADTNGKVTEGARTISINGVIYKQTFTCSFSLDNTGVGSAVCPIDNPIAGFPEEETFDFVVVNNGKQYRQVSTTPGTTIIGIGIKQ